MRAFPGGTHGAFIALLFLAIAPQAQAQRPIDCKLVTQVPVSECEALFDIFFSLNGTTWISNTGWLLAGNVCEWQGVDCNEKEWPRNVTGITIHDNDLSGFIPESIGLLPELRVLVLNNTVGGGFFRRIGGTLPSSIGSLQHMEVLDLGRNSITGTIPGEYGNLTKLRILNLSENQLEGPIPGRLYDIPSLQELNLHDNRLSGPILPAITGLASLAHLDLSQNQFSGTLPDVWDALPALQSVQLQHNLFEGPLPATLAQHPGLFFLKAHANRLGGALTPGMAAGLARLNVCELENNTGGLCLPDTPLFASTPVCNLTPATDCSFCRTPTDVPEASCRVLERLFYTTGGPAWTRRDGWFEEVRLCDWFGVGCIENQVVDLSLPSNNLSGALPEGLGTLPGLASLDLSNNQLVGRVPLALATRAAEGLSCSLAGNREGLCVPDEAPYRSLGVDPLCGLPLVAACAAPAQVRLEAVRVRMENGQIIVNWRTSASIPGMRFIVEQRAGGAYISVGEIEGAPADPVAPYEFRFVAEEGEILTLRLRAQLPDGTEQISDAVDLVRGDAGVTVIPPYPNPTHSRAEVALAVRASGPVVVALYDVLGRRQATVLDEHLEAGGVRYLTLDASGLTAGTYIVRIMGAAFAQSHVLTVRK